MNNNKLLVYCCPLNKIMSTILPFTFFPLIIFDFFCKNKNLKIWLVDSCFNFFSGHYLMKIKEKYFISIFFNVLFWQIIKKKVLTF